MNKNEVTNVTSKLTAQTRTLIDQLCNDNSWSAKVMDCDVKAFEETMAERLEKFQQCTDDEKFVFLDGVLDAIPKHLGVLKKDGKGTTAIKRARNFIHALATECHETVNDEAEFATLYTLRMLKDDILKDVKSDDKTSKERNFTSNDGNDENKKDGQKPDGKPSIFSSWIAKASSTVDEDGNIDVTDRGKCSRAIYAKITAIASTGEPSFGSYSMSYILKFSDWVAGKIFDTDAKVVEISAKGSFIDQTKKLLKMYKSETEGSANDDNSPTDDGDVHEEPEVSDETRKLYEKYKKRTLPPDRKVITLKEFNEMNEVAQFMYASADDSCEEEVKALPSSIFVREFCSVLNKVVNS